MSFPTWPNFSEEEIAAVVAVLKSGQVNYWTGKTARNFETAFSKFAGTKYAIAVANGTVALDLALYGLGIGARNGGSYDDEVVVSPRSFVASASTVVNAGAKPVFADIENSTQNLCPTSVRKSITKNTRAIICVHLAGWPCDVDKIREQVEDSNIKIIEDCAQAHGALYKQRPVGSLGDVAAWSFCQDKIMSTGGEGGMVTCESAFLWDRMWSFKDHGKDYEKTHTNESPQGFKWVHDSIGTNWRLTEMQAAIGLVQLANMELWSEKRRENASIIIGELMRWREDWSKYISLPANRCIGCECEASAPLCAHAFYKFYIQLNNKLLASGWSRDGIVQEINKRGVRCSQGSCPEIYLEKGFSDLQLKGVHLTPRAADLGKKTIMLEVHPTLEKHHMLEISNVLTSVLEKAFAK